MDGRGPTLCSGTTRFATGDSSWPFGPRTALPGAPGRVEDGDRAGVCEVGRVPVGVFGRELLGLPGREVLGLLGCEVLGLLGRELPGVAGAGREGGVREDPVDGCDGAGFEGAGFDGAGFDGAGFDGAGFDGRDPELDEELDELDGLRAGADGVDGRGAGWAFGASACGRSG